MQYVDEKDISLFQKVDTSSWESMKEDVRIRLIPNKYLKKEYSDDVVSKKFLDLAMCVQLQERKSDTYRSHVFTQKDIDKYGIDEDTLFNTASNNTVTDRSKRILTPMQHMSMNTAYYPVMGKIEGKMMAVTENNQPLGIIGGQDDKDNILVLCNKRNWFGSMYITQTKILDEIYERFDKTNFYIIPVSLFYVMCVKSTFAMQDGEKPIEEAEDDLMDMLEQLNDSMNDYHNVLSYKIYYYFGDDNKQLFLIK